MDLKYHPQSSATSESEFFGELMRASLRAQQSLGTASETLGITVPVTSPTNAAEYVQQQQSWQRDVIRRKGPMGYDTTDTPFESSYTQKRYDFISGEESVRRYAYDDATGKQITDSTRKRGLTTIGIGFNMDRPDARQVVAKALGLDGEAFDALYRGQRALSDVEVRKLADYTMNEAERIIANKFKGVDLTANERIALVSLAFNSPALIGPKLTAAIQSGDKRAALNEILYNSNRKGLAGLAARRYREAAMLAGTGSNDLPAFKEYLAQFSGSTRTV